MPRGANCSRNDGRARKPGQLMKTVKIELYYSREYEIQETNAELLEQLEQQFAESLDTFTILDNLDTTITESEIN